MADFEIFEIFLSEKQNPGMLFECLSSHQETAVVERSRKSRPTAGLCAMQRGADELRRWSTNSSPMNEGNFPLRKASRTRKTRKDARWGRASFAPLVAPSRACREMAPQWLEKIESGLGNGMASEASKTRHLVRGRAAHRALRRNSLGPPPTAQRPRFTNSKRRKADGKFSASQSIEIARNRKRISEAPTARWPRSTNSTREKAARKKLQKKAPNALKSLDAELKSSLAYSHPSPRRRIRVRGPARLVCRVVENGRPLLLSPPLRGERSGEGRGGLAARVQRDATPLI
jgi:hypothetical protein